MTIPHGRIRSALRKIWLYSDDRREALARSRLKRGVYACSSCHQETAFPEIDHVKPVGPTPGARGAPKHLLWDDYLERLFGGPENLQTLCPSCHRIKTAEGRKKAS